MRDRRTLIPAALIALVALPATPLAGQTPDIAAKRPDAPIFHFELDAWEEPVCAGATAWTAEVPPGQWIELPVGWIAVDHSTAIQNWDCMRFEIRTGGRLLEVQPQQLNWDLMPVRFECPGRTIEGMALAPVVYLPPVDGERTYELRYIFRADVDDGWSTYEAGSELRVNVTLRNPVEEGDGG